MASLTRIPIQELVKMQSKRPPAAYKTKSDQRLKRNQRPSDDSNGGKFRLDQEARRSHEPENTSIHHKRIGLSFGERQPINTVNAFLPSKKIDFSTLGQQFSSLHRRLSSIIEAI
jgi:hypothetical protein